MWWKMEMAKDNVRTKLSDVADMNHDVPNRNRQNKHLFESESHQLKDKTCHVSQCLIKWCTDSHLEDTCQATIILRGKFF